MIPLHLDGVTKRFGTAAALADVTLHAPGGAFLALLGPSGCGKTTLLRLLAGFERPSEGVVRFGDRVVSGRGVHRPPEDRHVAMVFQSYALWPHMTVSENVAYPLRIARLPKPDVAARVGAALAQVGLEPYAERRPDALSGGQRQRVALARALVQDAGLVLCDEPLANLDVHLRASMIETFKRLHRETGRTFVYVTHDQAEALALATEIAVLDRGRLVQMGPPAAIYGEPASEAVAAFVGRGSLLDVEVVSGPANGRAAARLDGTDILVRAPGATAPGPARLLVRPENVRLGGPIPAVVRSIVFRGATFEVTAEASGGTIVFDTPAAPQAGEALQVGIDDAWIVPRS